MALVGQICETKDRSRRAVYVAELRALITAFDDAAAARRRLTIAMEAAGTAELLRALEAMGVVMVATDAEAAPLSVADLVDEGGEDA